MPTALVTGATGILGREILFELAKDSSKWTTVYALSRSQKEEYPAHVKHQHIDLQASAAEMSKDLQEVKAEYVFFAAYLAKDDENQLAEVNGAMLQNFLSAIRMNGSEKVLKRVILVTGAKQYALHLGRPKMPMEESDPWVEGPGWPPNFYYVQQRILQKAAGESHWDWVVTYPNDVIGAVKNNFMNLATAIALYAAVSKELGEELIWPGSPTFYTASTTFTSAKLHAKFCHWAAEQDKVSNQGFNVINGDVVSWQSMWPFLAQRYGLKVAPDQMTRKLSYESGSMPLREQPPITIMADKLGLKGTDVLHPSKVESRVQLAKWSQRSEVREAWEKLASRQGLDKGIWDRATWGFCDFILGRNFDILISQSKARKYGWTGFVDTWESLEETWGELEKQGQLPKPSK